MANHIDDSSIDIGRSRYESIVALYTYNILFINDICCGQVLDSVHDMGCTPYYRHSFKMYLKAADRERRKYEKTVNSIIRIDYGEFFANCNEKFCEGVDDAIEMLYWQFKQVLDDSRVVYSAEIARFEIARTLCEFACILFDMRMKEIKNGSPRLGGGVSLGYLRMTEVSRLMNLASGHIGIERTVNMNTERCRLAFDILIRKLMDGVIIADAINVGNMGGELA